MATKMNFNRMVLIAIVLIFLFIMYTEQTAKPQQLIDTSKPIKFRGTANGGPIEITMNLAKETLTTCTEVGGAPYCQTLKQVDYTVLENTPEICRIKACFEGCAEFTFKADKSVTVHPAA